MFTLAIETSCDETSAAVLKDNEVCSNIISSQISHSRYGGVVPEVSSREHLRNIITITHESIKSAKINLNDIDIIAATYGPGLVGSLLIGLNFAKSISLIGNIPFIPVNHISAHLYSNLLGDQKPEFPFIGLVVSGGHTLLILVEDFFKHIILGRTIDDAAGEAFDKVAKLLGLDYPGGALIDRLALEGNNEFHKFPISRVKGNKYNFSFSGIKTSVLYFLRKIEFEKNKNEQLTRDISASFQDSIVRDLFNKTFAAAEDFKIRNISVSGGVSANSNLRNKFKSVSGYNIYFPKPEFATDNAAMIGLTGYYLYTLSKNKNYFESESLKQTARAKFNYEMF